MPVVRVSEADWERMKRWATPLEDSADDVITRLLEIAEGSSGTRADAAARQETVPPTKSRKSSRLPRGKRVPQVAYRRPILEALYEFGERGPIDDILSKVEQKLKHLLDPIDYEKLKGGEVRWRNAAQWERKQLIEDGLLMNESPRGIWELSEDGVREVEGNQPAA